MIEAIFHNGTVGCSLQCSEFLFNYPYGPRWSQYIHSKLTKTEKLGLLTGDVIVCETLELESHVVGTELLELDGEFDVFLWLVARHQDIWVQYCAAGLRLLFLHQVEFIKLIRPPHVPLRADNVQFIPDLRVDHQALPRHKPATQNVQRYNKSHAHNLSVKSASLRSSRSRAENLGSDTPPDCQNSPQTTPEGLSPFLFPLNNIFQNKKQFQIKNETKGRCRNAARGEFC